MPRFVRRAVLACAAATLVLTGCTAGPSARPAIVGGEAPAPAKHSPSKADKPKPAPLDPSRSSSLSWRPCSSTVRHNLDSAGAELPGGKRAACSSISPRLGEDTVPSLMNAKLTLLRAGHGPVPLLVLDDVNGEPGTVYAAKLAKQLPDKLLRKFTLIGMDRRGTGDSQAIDCIPAADRRAILGHDPQQTKLDNLVTAERNAVQGCQSDMENKFTSFNTHNTVNDLDLLRKRLGVQRLNAIGRGEGSRVLGQYGTKFPQHVGRMAFDGYPDPNAEIQDRFETRAEAAEHTFDAFARSCTTHGDCALGRHPRATVTKLLGSLRDKPLSTSEGVSLGPGLAVNAILTGLAEHDRWDELAKALDKARSGHGTGLAAFVRPQLLGSEHHTPRLDGATITTCNDQDSRPPPKQVSASMKQWRDKHPLFGATYGQRLLQCLPWPQPEKPLVKPHGNRLPTLLVLSTAHDPVTPAEGTERLAQQLRSAVRVDWQGAGHGALGESSCATEKVTGYFLHGKTPSSDSTCPA